MRIHALLAAAALSTALTGCYTYPAYPVYQQAPIARLSPEQSAALANQQNQNLSQADRNRIASDNAQVARDDQTTQSVYGAPVYPAYPATPYYAAPYAYYDSYPYYYGGFYPWYPGVSLSFGFGRYYGGYHGGGFRGHR